jgi:dGTPase
MLDWNILISSQRVWDDGNLHDSSEQPDRTPFQVDYDRVIFSEPFRHLAKKTQVHPLVPNDHIRNRLTHSLEVAGVGRSFGTRLFRHLQTTNPPSASEDDFRCILQTACLTHDIGNPPFGHAGEFAIRLWVNENPDSVFGESGEFAISEGVKNDWRNFEGNAQGFRLACRADNPRFGYMNLTTSTLGAMVKYPWDSSSKRVLEAIPRKRKFNCFASEKDFFDTVFDSLGLKKGESYVRHPLSFLSEAADDLCYRIADLEDAVKMNILGEERVREILFEVCGSGKQGIHLGKLRANAVGCFIEAFWGVFVREYDEIMSGQREDDLKDGLDATYKTTLKRIDECYQEIFAHRFKVATELGAFNCLGNIIKVICKAAQQLCKIDFSGTNNLDGQLGTYKDQLDFRSKRCFELSFGEKYVKENLNQTYEWWLHQILDFVSGMTDNFAQQFAHEIQGY